MTEAARCSWLPLMHTHMHTHTHTHMHTHRERDTHIVPPFCLFISALLTAWLQLNPHPWDSEHTYTHTHTHTQSPWAQVLDRRVIYVWVEHRAPWSKYSDIVWDVQIFFILFSLNGRQSLTVSSPKWYDAATLLTPFTWLAQNKKMRMPLSSKGWHESSHMYCRSRN